MKRSRCLLLFLLVLPGIVHAQSAGNWETGLHPEAFVTNGETVSFHTLQQRMAARKVTGVSVAVVNNNSIVSAKGYGHTENGGSAVDTNTLFQCASIGKVVTAFAALHLVQQGKLSLDEPVNNYLRSWKIPENELTATSKVSLRHLLSHSAGLTDAYGFEGYAPHAAIPQLLDMLESKPPANTRKQLIVKTIPGTVEKYSGGGFLVVQQLIEDISGLPFDQYVDSIVFRPLGMIHSTYSFYPDELSGLTIARGHDGNGKIDKQKKYHVYPEMAAAGFWTTATDLARLAIALQQEYAGTSDKVAGQKLMKEMLSPQINTTGLGIHLKGSSGVSAFWHSGNNAGYTGLFFFTPDGKAAVVLTNSDDGAWFALEVVRSIADAFNWPAMQTRVLKPTSGPEYTKLTGSYKKGSTRILIEQDKNGLMLNTGSKSKFTLYQLADGSFIIKEKPEHLKLVFADAQNAIPQQLHFYQDCGKVVGTLDLVKE